MICKEMAISTPIKGATITIVPMYKTVPIIVEHIIHEVWSTKRRQTLKIKKRIRPLRKLQDSSNISVDRDGSKY